MNLNKVMVIGRMTKQPDARNTPSGTVVCSFSVATNRSYSVQGQRRDETEFVDVTAFGKQAETIAKYFGKGDEIYVEGRLKKSTWEKKDGSKGYRTDVILEKFEFGQKVAKRADGPGPVGPGYMGKSAEEGPKPEDAF